MAFNHYAIYIFDGHFYFFRSFFRNAEHTHRKRTIEKEKNYIPFGRAENQIGFYQNEIDKHIWHLFSKLIVFKSLWWAKWNWMRITMSTTAIRKIKWNEMICTFQFQVLILSLFVATFSLCHFGLFALGARAHRRSAHFRIQMMSEKYKQVKIEKSHGWWKMSKLISF